MKARSVFLALAVLALPITSAEQPFIPAWVDVEIDVGGLPTSVALVEPPLPPSMAAPIEQVVRSWRFTPGSLGGARVPRTTSVALAIRLVRDPGGNEQIIAEKRSEGPRILERARPDCLRTMSQSQPHERIQLGFTVTASGRVEDLSAMNSAATKEQIDCAMETMRSTLFKPETVGGKAVASQVVQDFRAR